MAASKTASRTTDKQIVAALKRTKRGKTAAQLGVAPARLASIPGVVQLGTLRRPQRGRPPHVFGYDASAA